MTLVHLLSMAAQAVQERAEVKKQNQKSESFAQLMKNTTRKDQNKVKNQEAHHEADAFEKKKIQHLKICYEVLFRLNFI